MLVTSSRIGYLSLSRRILRRDLCAFLNRLVTVIASIPPANKISCHPRNCQEKTELHPSKVSSVKGVYVRVCICMREYWDNGCSYTPTINNENTDVHSTAWYVRTTRVIPYILSGSSWVLSVRSTELSCSKKGETSWTWTSGEKRKS